MLPQDKDSGADVVKEILNYFVRNPNATDTLEGVARWRLLEEQAHRTVEETATALAFLVARGYLEEVPTSGANKVFRLDPQRVAEAAHFLAEQGSGKKDKP